MTNHRFNKLEGWTDTLPNIITNVDSAVAGFGTMKKKENDSMTDENKLTAMDIIYIAVTVRVCTDIRV